MTYMTERICTLHMTVQYEKKWAGIGVALNFIFFISSLKLSLLQCKKLIFEKVEYIEKK